ncbi:MAG TPA: winged helix DNA-binding domain-containing protein [Glaciibacter sp.]|nr:winged helix DNA-binding domain-containing protein [Glaciibacter sp.]
MAAPVISQRALGRATLARQLLLERSPMAPVDAVRHLVGLQAQTPQTWYTGLWSRLLDFDATIFGRQLEDRVVVRMALMRSTIHLVAAEDAAGIRRLVQPVIERSTRGAFARQWDGLDLDEVAGVARELLDAQPMTFAELGARLQEQWPEHDRTALGQVARSALPLVQVPPRGVWRRSGPIRHTTLEAWVGDSVGAPISPDVLVRRYLAAFGPASVMDIQAWCGLTRLREVVDRLRPGLLVFRSEAGRELFDLPDAPRPREDVPAPPRFLYDYDNLLLSHADRSRFLIHNLFEFGWTFDGPQPSALLVDGRVEATWVSGRDDGSPVLSIRPLGSLSAQVRDEIAGEGAKLLAFLAGGRGDERSPRQGEIRFLDH